MRTDHRGQVVAFDGPDGVGKTTQIELSAEFLRQQRFQVCTTRASGGTPIGEALRSVSLSSIDRPPETDLYISMAMHTALGQELPSLRQKFDFILIDRSPLAIVAYNVFGSQLKNRSTGYAACRQMLQLWQLDKLVLFEAALPTLSARRTQRAQSADYFEKQGNAYAERVISGYHRAGRLTAIMRPRIPLVKINAEPSAPLIQDKLQKLLLSLVH